MAKSPLKAVLLAHTEDEVYETAAGPKGAD